MATVDNAGDVKATSSVISLQPKEAIKGDSNARRSLRRLMHHKMAIFGAILLVGILLYTILGAFVYSESFANLNDTKLRLQPPSAAHVFGTDEIGRDILARTIWGGQISLFIGVTAVLVEILVGTVVGLLAGYFGGWLDSLLMRIVEAMLSIPQLFLALLAVRVFADKIPDFTIFGRTFSNTLIVIIFVIGLTSWMGISRIVRAEVLSLKEQEFVTAARSIGASNFRIVMKHILPNCFAPLLVSATLGVANAILLEAYLGFLGLGVRPPTATWGTMLTTANSQLAKYWMWLAPSTLLILTVLGVNNLGDGLRDAFDPKSSNK
jgi:peptide/nickel transport system permease protein